MTYITVLWPMSVETIILAIENPYGTGDQNHGLDDLIYGLYNHIRTGTGHRTWYLPFLLATLAIGDASLCVCVGGGG